MERPDRFAFNEHLGDELRQGLPPVVGSDGGSAWFAGGGHLAIGEFPLSTSSGFYFGLDIQPDQMAPQMVLGSAWAESAFLLRIGDPGPGIIALTIRDGSGRELLAHGHGSMAAARRLLVVGHASSNRVAMYELQPWAEVAGRRLPVEIIKAGAPLSWPVSASGLAIGGSRVDGVHQAGFQGRISEFFVGDRELEEERAQELAAATDNPTDLDFGNLGPPTRGLRDRFRRDLARLRGWVTASRTNDGDLDDASLILFRWLFDGHPVLVDIASKLGVQLWLPGMTAHERAYLDVVQQDKPTFQVAGALGSDSMFGLQWRPLSEWRHEPVFHTNGRPVSHEAFIKFVRNKLGAGHFDETERTKWQRELLELSAGLQLMGQDTLVYQMREIVEAVLHGIAVSRLEVLAEG